MSICKKTPPLLTGLSFWKLTSRFVALALIFHLVFLLSINPSIYALDCFECDDTDIGVDITITPNEVDINYQGSGILKVVVHIQAELAQFCFDNPAVIFILRTTVDASDPRLQWGREREEERRYSCRLVETNSGGYFIMIDDFVRLFTPTEAAPYLVAVNAEVCIEQHKFSMNETISFDATEWGLNHGEMAAIDATSSLMTGFITLCSSLIGGLLAAVVVHYLNKKSVTEKAS